MRSIHLGLSENVANPDCIEATTCDQGGMRTKMQGQLTSIFKLLEKMATLEVGGRIDSYLPQVAALLAR